MPAKRKSQKTMNEVSSGYEAFISGKKILDNNGQLFDKVLKKASKPAKQRGLK